MLCYSLFYLKGSTRISWKTKKQHTVSLSFIEVEYHAMANAMSEAVWIQNLLRSFHIPILVAQLYHDNQAIFHIAANSIFHSVSNILRLTATLFKSE